MAKCQYLLFINDRNPEFHVREGPLRRQNRLALKLLLQSAVGFALQCEGRRIDEPFYKNQTTKNG
jgi:hypothetical protein